MNLDAAACTPFRLGAVRQISPEPGMTGEICYPTSDTSAGWPAGTKVRVIGGPPRQIVVEDAAGRAAVFPHECIDLGCEYQEGEHWYHESEAFVLDALAAHVAKLESVTWDSVVESGRLEVTCNIRRRLARYGR